MASGVPVADSGDGDIDALLAGSKWNSSKLTFSFPTSAGVYSYSGEPDQDFQAFIPNLKAAAREIFDTYSQYINVTFTETTSSKADIRLGMADIGVGGRGYFPSDGAKNGDLWLPTDHTWDIILVDDNDGDYLTLMHEIGHTLGLSHPGFEMNPDHVGYDYTIMSYLAYPGDEHIGGNDQPQTPMCSSPG